MSWALEQSFDLSTNTYDVVANRERVLIAGESPRQVQYAPDAAPHRA